MATTDLGLAARARRAAPLVAVVAPPGTDVTSAAEAIAPLLGLSRADTGVAAGALLPSRPRALDDVGERVLRSLGGTWDAPPPLAPGWEHAPPLDELAAEAAALLTELFADPSRVVIWGGVTLPLLLPFWRRASERPVVALLVHRDPAESAAELVRRGACDAVRALALYERYTRAALGALAGLPVHAVRHQEIALGPESTAGGLERLLAGSEAATGSTTSEPSVTGAGGGRARSAAAPRGEDLVDVEASVLDSQRGLALVVEGLLGSHPALPPLALGPESPWTAAVLGLERDLTHVLHGLTWATRQLEPLMRMEPRPPSALGTSDAAPADDPEDASEASEPDEAGPYPLNASEDRRAYHRWLAARRLPIVVGGPTDPPLHRAVTKAPLRQTSPLVSLLVPVWRTPLWVLERCVSSVFAQTFADWELCLCDDASADADLAGFLRRVRRADRRVRTSALEVNGGISAATNGALAMARGRFVAFLDHDDELTPDALEVAAGAIASEPEGDVFYSDEDKIDASGERFDPLFKPDWSPDLLLSFQYLGHLTLVSRALVVELGGLRSDYDGSQDYDLALRATERARKVVHIPEVLYHWRTLPGSAASDSSGGLAKPWAYEAGLRAIEDALARRGEEAEVSTEPRFAGRYHVRRAPTSHPLVSVVIPFRDEPALLATCCASLRADPGYDRVELVLVDNGSELPETAALLDRLDGGDDVKIVRAPGPFNWAAINNAAVEEAAGEVLLFANNDIEARAPRWLHAMLGHALRPAVGAVGARLIYPDGAIQHAGVVVGLGGIAGHVLRGLPGDHPGYNSMAFQTRDCSVVTGACMMTRREVFDSVGGFDERLPVAFNDVDYCLKLREKGLLVVYTPLAELVHHESRSRGHTDDLAESRRILGRWADVIIAGDPYLNRNLSHWRYWCPLSTAQEDDRWKTYLETSVSMRGRSSTTSASS